MMALIEHTLIPISFSYHYLICSGFRPKVMSSATAKKKLLEV